MPTPEGCVLVASDASVRVEVPGRLWRHFHPWLAALVLLVAGAAVLIFMGVAEGGVIKLTVATVLLVIAATAAFLGIGETASSWHSRAIEVRPGSLLLEVGSRRMDIPVEDIYSLDVQWARVPGDPSEGLRHLSLWADGSGEVLFDLSGIPPGDLRRLWAALVRLVMARELSVDDGMLRYLKHCWARGVTTGLEDYPALVYARKLAVPDDVKGEPLLRPAAAWRRRYLLADWGTSILAQVGLLPLLLLYFYLTLLRDFPYTAPTRSALTTGVAIAGVTIVLLAAWSRVMDLMPDGEVPGLHEGGIQLTSGDGFVPWSEVDMVSLSEAYQGRNRRLEVTLKHDPASGEQEEDADLSPDFGHLVMVRALGRDGVEELMERVGLSRVDPGLREWWEGRW